MKKSLYFGGDILTMEGQRPEYVEALLSCDGRIQKLGPKDTLMELAGEDTEYVDLKGKTLLPSFIDPHSHITAFASTLGFAGLGEAGDFKELADAFENYIAENRIPDGELVIGFGYDHNNFSENRHPDRHVLDRIEGNHPVVAVHASGHMGVLNTQALRMFGITADSEDPEGGRIGREPGSREPNGYLEEKAFIGMTGQMAPLTLEQIGRGLEKAQEIYLKNGITTVQDGLTGTREFEQLEYAAEQGLFTLDVNAYVDLKNAKELMEKGREYTGDYRGGLRLAGYKIILDGSPQGRTAWLSKPYEGAEDGYRGYASYPDEQVRSFVEQSEREGRQLLAHCNGDAASEQLIQAYDHPSKLRPVMIHAQTVRDDQLARMKEIGMIPSFFLAHTYFWGDIHRKNLGVERAERISPVKSAIGLGMPYTFHQDTPVIMPDMIKTVWCAVNRRTKSGKILGEGQRITPYEALKGVTEYAAYQYFEEGQKGTLAPGKRADLVILSENPLKCDPMRIDQIQVLQTVKDGEVLFSNFKKFYR